MLILSTSTKNRKMKHTFYYNDLMTRYRQCFQSYVQYVLVKSTGDLIQMFHGVISLSATTLFYPQILLIPTIYTEESSGLYIVCITTNKHQTIVRQVFKRLFRHLCEVAANRLNHIILFHEILTQLPMILQLIIETYANIQKTHCFLQILAYWLHSIRRYLDNITFQSNQVHFTSCLRIGTQKSFFR